MSRYVIRDAKGLFYSDNRVVDVVPVPRKGDPSQNDMVRKFAPVFRGAIVDQAIKYQSESDARDVAGHADVMDAAAFADCTICQTEYDTDDMAAVRDVGPV